MADPFDLERFVRAQNHGGTYEAALSELRRGRKETHWMWFVFPQVAGLGRSATAEQYALRSLAEAQAYLAHPVLGPRLRECAAALLSIDDRSATQVLGTVDAQKLRSSMTLFHRADEVEPVFREILERYFDGEPDQATDSRLSSASSGQAGDGHPARGGKVGP